ncbi:hypothetical protein Tco_0039196 [Tanacetum coccineum]
MSWFSRCSWCGGPFNGGNCRHCTNVSFRDEPVYDSNPNSYNQTSDISNPPSQPQTSSINQFHCFHCGDPLEDGVANLTTYPLQRFKSFCYDDDDDYDYKESVIPLNEIDSQIPPSNAITPVLLTLKPKDSLIMGNKELSTVPEKESDEFIKFSVEDLVPIPSQSEDTSRSDSECDLPSCDDFSPINILERKSVTFSNLLFNLNDDFTSSDDESLSNEDVPKDNVKIYSNPLFEFDDEYISSDVNPLFNKVLENIESKDSYVSNLDESTLLVTPLFKLNEDECFDRVFKSPIPIEDSDSFFEKSDTSLSYSDNSLPEFETFSHHMEETSSDSTTTHSDIVVSTDIVDDYYDSEGDIIYLESLFIKDTTPNLPLEDCPDFEGSRARGFVHRSLDL